MALTQPPFLESVLFENPWPAVVAFAAIGSALIWLGRSRANQRQMLAGAIAFALGAAVFVSAKLVTTTREQCISETERLVAAVTPLQMNTIRLLLDKNVTLSDETETRSGEEIFKGLESMAGGRFGLESQTIKNIEAEAVGSDQVRVLMDVLTIAQRGRVSTRWLLDWRKVGEDRWRVVGIEWLPPSDTTIGVSPNLGYVPRYSPDTQ